MPVPQLRGRITSRLERREVLTSSSEGSISRGLSSSLPSALEQSLSRRQFLVAAGAGAASLALPKRASSARGVHAGGNLVPRWNDAFLEGVRNSKLGPPMVARALAIAHTCIYDAWAAYDDKAVGTRLASSLRRPPRERTAANAAQAISFAACRAAVDLFPGSDSSVFDPLMRSLGYDAADHSTDTTTPTGIGNVAAQAVLDFHHRDGANQLGDELGGGAGVPYSDYTGYVPANNPMDIRVPFDPTTVRDPNAWQPLRYVDGGGTVVTPGFVGAQWQHVTTFAVNPGSLRSSTGPAKYGSPEYVAQAQSLLELSAALTDEQKMIAEYWADGPRSELPPGHWNLFAQFVSRRDHRGDHEHGLERDVKLFFALTNALSDAGCCAWDNKRAFNSVRPITAIRTVFRGQMVRAWGGPYEGTKLIDGATWLPYQPTMFPTPPFPEYSSGHSNFSAASAEILKRFTHSDRFGASVTLPAGSSRTEPGAVPSSDITLSWSTFSDAANEAGISRRYGGIHFEQGDLDARATGRTAARLAWERARDYWEGG
ncbi:MAG: vanadium-dependent haloperoxidase [Actinobacteria bacterium]|nr:MAG: vanadium-dependent haloperoxidase [Actinomycetota bacterium]